MRMSAAPNIRCASTTTPSRASGAPTIRSPSTARPASTPNYLAPRLAYGTAGGVMAYVPPRQRRRRPGHQLRAVSPTSQALGGIVVKAFDASPGTGGGIDSFELASLTNGNIALLSLQRRRSRHRQRHRRPDRDSNGALVVSKAVVSGAVRNDDVDIAALQGGGFVVTWAKIRGNSTSSPSSTMRPASRSPAISRSPPPRPAMRSRPPSSASATRSSAVVAWADSWMLRRAASISPPPA